MASKSYPQRETTNPSPELKPEERHRMVAEAAYFRAEKRGFRGGNPETDWMEAEAEVETLMAGKKTRTRGPEPRTRSPRSASP